MHAKDDHQHTIALTLAVAPADAARLAKHPLLRAHAIEAPHTEQLVTSYFDTPSQRLRQHGATLSVCQAGNVCVQAFLADAGPGCLGRSTIEAGIPGPGIDLAALRAGIGKHGRWRKLLHSRTLQDELHPLFDSRASRCGWELRLPGGTEIVAALDSGTIECGGQREGFAELALELKAGAPAALYRFALELHGSVALRLAGRRIERGYALCAGEPLQTRAPLKFTPRPLAPGMTVDQAFRAIAESCLVQVLGNADGVVHGADPEQVHQMRVGMRHLRSALGLFREVAPLPLDLNHELRWLGAELGAARDWEVLAHSTLAPLQQRAPADIAGLGLAHAAAGVAEARRAAAAQALQAPRYTTLMLQLLRWLLGAEWRSAASQWQLARLDAPLRRFAAAELARSLRRLRKRGKRLRGADAATRHQARIAAKKARYTMEFFAALYQPRQVEKYTDALSGLQDALGRLNDAAVADQLLQELATQQAGLAPAVGFARGYLAGALERAATPLDKRWQRFARCELPRRAG